VRLAISSALNFFGTPAASRPSCDAAWFFIAGFGIVAFARHYVAFGIFRTGCRACCAYPARTPDICPFLPTPSAVFY
jgi:hypothetical protein